MQIWHYKLMAASVVDQFSGFKNVPGSGMMAESAGPAEIIMWALVGGLAGFVIGMMIGVLAQMASYLRSKPAIGGPKWGAAGAFLGGIAAAVWKVVV